MNKAGRVCPADYRLSDEIFRGKPEVSCDTLYVVGGLYGNQEALKALKERVEKEKDASGKKIKVVFNGDMHWFDKDAADFTKVEELTDQWIKMIGNVEAELRRPDDIGVGCGCAYPACVSQDSVDRSNIIHGKMKEMLKEHPELVARLKDRAAAKTVLVAGHKVGITHGDETMIGGWNCSWEELQKEERKKELDAWMEDHQVEVLATTHTCAPVAATMEYGAVINNGATGMPNFEEEKAGLLTRISTEPCEDAIYRAVRNGLYIEAVPVRFDREAFLDWFDRVWPEGSEASVSYRSRIVDGVKGEKPEYAIQGEFACL